MAKKIIEARVIQKVATEAEWLQNNLVLYKGEIALVSSGDNVVNMKVGDGAHTFSELEYMYRGGFQGSINPTTTTSTLTNGFYFAETSGTYTNANNVVVAEGYYTILEKNDSGWKVSSSVKMPEASAEGKVEEGNTQAVSGGEVFDNVQIREKISNILKNGSFLVDSDWQVNNATKVFTTGILEVTPTSAPANTTTVQHLYQSVTLNTTHKYYVACELKGKYDLRVQFSSTIINRYFSEGNYNYLDSIIIPTSGVVRAIGVTDPTPDGTPFFVKKMILIDLTELYGAGNEPVLEDFRKIVQYITWDNQTKDINTNDDIINELDYFKTKESSKFLNVDNSVKNGDFEKGILKSAVVNYDMWNTYTAPANVTLTNGGLNGTKAVALRQDASVSQKLRNKVGDKMYISVNVRFKNGAPLNNGCYVRIMANNAIKQSFSKSNILVNNTYNRISFVTEGLTDLDSVLIIYVTGNSDFTIELDSIVVINLTEQFNEVTDAPTIEELDNFISKQPNYYFDNADFIILNDFRNRINRVEKEIKEANLKKYADKFFISDNFKGYFSALDRTYTNHSSDFESLKHTDIYNWFDALVTNNPGYATKTTLNTVTTPDGVQNINMYSFKPPTDSTLPIKFPVIFIIAGAHGNEKQPPLACYNLMKDVCEKWKENEYLKFLRFNCEIRIIPCINMYGFDRNTRKNHNGVDINRNYSYGWYAQDISSVTYGGANAFSEIESQTVRDYLLANKVDILIDFHNFANNGVDNYIWTQSPVDKLNKITSNVVRNLTAKWKQEYPSVNQSNIGVFGYTEKTTSIYGSVEQYAFYTLGIHSTLLEVDQEFTPLIGDLGYSIISQKTAEETACNMLLYIINQIDN